MVFSFLIGSLDESTEIVSSTEVLSTSPFEILSPDASQDMPKPKMIKNLKEFYHIGRPKSLSSIPDISPSDANASIKSSTYDSLHNTDGDADSNGQVFLDDLASDEGNTPTERSCLHDSTKTFKAFMTSNGGDFMSQNVSRSYTEGEGSRMRATVGENSELSTSINQIHYSEEHEASCEFNPLDSPEESPDGDVMTTSADFITPPQNTFRGGSTSKSDIEGTSQGFESEHDSGHCLSESFENSVEPEFQTGSSRQPTKMPSPETLGGGNPFLMFLCLTLLLQHRDHIMKNHMDYNETAMYFDKMIRKHNVGRVLAHARQMYSNYLKQNVSHA